ncbi:5-formyltetrahydrofolate cyclo-ligase [Carnobacteriaceae bacterium zg-ZUI78]|nr:5-formyltetrahydrofolate cyclo-ligase [Carnobacteriaceae bacterium zg-ZUI78]NEW66646.1 5-formyltetrahydrofolate cyclo-ligase [Granulicatella sp. zg-84]QMI85333.1 5-formyltetrahydrofolate cyclo-ligase [Carnobacteriaceae bacterium zg-84]
MNKKDMRKLVLQRMSTVSKERREYIEQTLMTKLLETSLWKEAKTIGITLSTFPEWETRRIIEEAWRQHKTVVVPKVIKKGVMVFNHYTIDTPLEISAFGIDEPVMVDEVTQIDLLVVPGVAFQKNGARLGFGGGFYDRYLQDFEGKTVSLVAMEQMVDIVPLEKHDIFIATILNA